MVDGRFLGHCLLQSGGTVRIHGNSCTATVHSNLCAEHVGRWGPNIRKCRKI